MIKLCVFDLDGTVLDTVGTIAYYGNYALEKHGIEPIEKKEYNFCRPHTVMSLLKDSVYHFAYKFSKNQYLFEQN